MLLQTCPIYVMPWDNRARPAPTGCCSGASRTPRPLSSPAAARPSCSGRARRRRTSVACTVRWGSAGLLLSPQQLQACQGQRSAYCAASLPRLPAEALPCGSCLLCSYPPLPPALPHFPRSAHGREDHGGAAALHSAGPRPAGGELPLCRDLSAAAAPGRLGLLPKRNPHRFVLLNHHMTPVIACAQVGKTTLIKGLIKHYTRQVGCRGEPSLVSSAWRRQIAGRARSCRHAAGSSPSSCLPCTNCLVLRMCGRLRGPSRSLRARRGASHFWSAPRTCRP